jgi:hypothetical protein
LDYSFIPNEEYKVIFKYIFDYYGANQKSPTLGTLSQNVPEKDSYLNVIEQIREVNIHDRKDEILKEFETFIRKSRFVKLHQDVKEIYNKGEADKAMNLLAEESVAINAFSLVNKKHSRIFTDFNKRQVERRQRDFSQIKMATGIPAFDHHTRGGVELGKSLLAIARKGVGKAQPLYSKIYTPNGFTTMGEIKIGDEILTQDGSTTKVIRIFDQGIRNVYRIYFSDGVTVDADEDHLWKIYTHKDRKRVADSLQYKKTSIKKDRHSILTTKQLSNDIRVTKQNTYNYKLPICAPLNFSKKRLDIPPYTLGALIGDGCFSNGTFSSADQQIIDRISSELKCKKIRKTGKYEFGFPKCKIKERLRLIFDNKLSNSYDKYIPREYLYSDVEDRINLLRGLIDTDGYINQKGNCFFNTSSERLAKDTCELVRGLGGIVKLHNHGKPSYVSPKTGKRIYSKYDHWQLAINMPPHINPCYLKRKSDRVRPKSKYVTPRYVEKVEFIGQMPTRCIMVEHPSHLYITDNCVVTHNSTFLRWLGFNFAFRGFTGIHFQGEGARTDVENAYDSMWTGIGVHEIKKGELGSRDYDKLEQSRQQFLANSGEIIVVAYEQFDNANMAECRQIIIDLMKEFNIKWALFDYLEKFNPGDGRRYGTTAESDRIKKLATAEKIVNIATEFKIFTGSATQANDIEKKDWDNPAWVITRNNISNLRATLDPFAYTVTLNQTLDESDKDIIRIHEESFRDYKLSSHESTYHVAQRRDLGRFIDLARTNQTFWDPVNKKVIKTTLK